MDYIFVSAIHGEVDRRLQSIDDGKVFSFMAETQTQYVRSDREITSDKRRLLHRYAASGEQNSTEPPPSNKTNAFEVFHGYSLGRTDVADPAVNYYGVYSHGKVTEEDCWFATDEIGLSPLYYSLDDDYIFVANNPHLIALYQRELGRSVVVEPTLPIWHITGITVESDKTGYSNINRVRPWRFIHIDQNNEISFPAKKRTPVPESYHDAVEACVDELRTGLDIISQNSNKLEAQLTGGLDSRLVLSFILASNLESRFLFTTQGRRKNPDYAVAKMLARKYGLHHKRVPYEHLRIPRKDLATTAKRFCLQNAMESSFIRLNGKQGHDATKITLNGFGAVFSKSLNYAGSFKAHMSKMRGEEAIDYDNLSAEQLDDGRLCFGYSKEDLFFLTPQALDISNDYRRYIMDFNYARFPENMNYADSLSAYRYRNHNAGLSTRYCNTILLYSPTVLETSRMLSPELRNEGKLFFDIMWRINQDICLIPYENRTYNPIVVEELPLADQERLLAVPPMMGDSDSDAQKRLIDTLAPILRNDLIDMLPPQVFDYVKIEAVKEALQGEFTFGKTAFDLINLYGIAQWYSIIDELNH